MIQTIISVAVLAFCFVFVAPVIYRIIHETLCEKIEATMRRYRERWGR